MVASEAGSIEGQLQGASGWANLLRGKDVCMTADHVYYKVIAAFGAHVVESPQGHAVQA